LAELVDGNKPIQARLFVPREGQPDEALPPFYGNIVWSGCMIPVEQQRRSHQDARRRRRQCAIGSQRSLRRGTVHDRYWPVRCGAFPVGAIHHLAAWGGFTTDSETDGKFTVFFWNKCRQLSGCDVTHLAREFTQ
jgi:hypothetical protein